METHEEEATMPNEAEIESETLPPRPTPVTTTPSPKWKQKRRSCLARYRCLLIIALIITTILSILWIVPAVIDPTKRNAEKRALDRKWIDSSPYVMDRMACRWLSLCGIHHIRSDPAEKPSEDDSEGQRQIRLELRTIHEEFRGRRPISDLQSDSKSGAAPRIRSQKAIPEFVLKHAPLVHLHDEEYFWPSDIHEFIEHMGASLNFDPIVRDQNLTLDNMADLNQYSTNVVLESKENVESRPEWLYSASNRPVLTNDTGEAKTTIPTERFKPSRRPWYNIDELKSLRSRAVMMGRKPNEEGRSAAPAVLVVVDKGEGIVDAFWFFFYAYNFGQTVLGMRFGNHVGDWEHCMIRFENGVPRGVFLSEHEGGLAYTWESLDKRTSSDGTQRPIIYSAVGSHAMYATSGNHPYVLPFNMLKDVTSKGPIWDPSLNNYAFHYEPTPKQAAEDRDTSGTTSAPDVTILSDRDSLIPATSNPNMSTSWFHYRGAWGDDLYPLADQRQWRLFAQYHYVRGPAGPKWKKLARTQLCTKKICRILRDLKDKGTWHQ